MKHHVKIFTIAILFMIVFAAQGSAETIKLVVAEANRDHYSYQESQALRATELVVKKFNANGGILGQQVELLTENETCNYYNTLDMASNLDSNGANMVMGYTCIDAQEAGLGIYRDAKIIAMSPSVTVADQTLSGEYPNYFRTAPNDDQQARLQVTFAAETLKVKTVYIIHDKSDTAKGLSILANRYFGEAGIEVVQFEGVTPGAFDYSDIVAKIRRMEPELVVWNGGAPEASKIVKLMRIINKMDTLFMAGNGMEKDTFIEETGEYAEGIYAVSTTDISSNPMAKTAKEEYQTEFGEDPGPFFDTAYAGALAMLKTIEKAGSTDYDTVVNALRTETVDTPLGKIKFDEKGDVIGFGFTVYKITGGQFVEQSGQVVEEPNVDEPSLLNQTQVSQLYVSIFGRASEGDGNAYWCSTHDNMVTAANTMLNTDPAKNYFGDTLNDNHGFIEFIYENTLGKTYAEDPDGVNYWVSELTSGKSKGEVISALINACMDPKYTGTDAQNRFVNKVAVSNYVADTIATCPDINDLSLFIDFISGVTHENSTVTTSKQAVIDSITPSNETPKLQLTYAGYFPLSHRQSLLAESWCKEVEKRSNGDISIEFNPGNTLILSSYVHSGVVKGAVDIGFTSLSNHVGRFPTAAGIDLPHGYTSGSQATTVANLVYNEFQPTELDDTKIMYLNAPGPGLIHTSNEKVTGMADLQGLNIASGDPVASRIVEALGGDAIYLKDAYLALQTGIVQGSIHPMEANFNQKFGEFVKYGVKSSAASYTTTYAVVMNNDTWNRLTLEQQEIITEINAEWIGKHAEAWDSDDAAGLEYFKAQGGEIVELSAEEEENWKTSVEPVIDTYIEQAAKEGVDGQAVIDFIKSNM